MAQLKIAATGLGGLVGSRIQELLHDDFEFIHLNHDTFDITDKNSVEQTLGSLDYDLFLHLAAYTNVDKAELDEKAIAFSLNVTGTKNVFDITKQKNKHFIYVSTGFVFDGNNPPYDEDSQPSPISYYGETKYEGEKIIGKKGMIVRIEYPYRKHFLKKNDFVRTIVQLLQKGQPIKGIQDSLITPTYIDDIAGGLKYLINNYTQEIFHLVGSNSLSPYAAAIQIADQFGLDKQLISPITYNEYFAGKAKRPRLAQIESKKNNFYPMKSFEEGLQSIK